jgi:hypothetical protein
MSISVLFTQKTLHNRGPGVFKKKNFFFAQLSQSLRTFSEIAKSSVLPNLIE